MGGARKRGGSGGGARRLQGRGVGKGAGRAGPAGDVGHEWGVGAGDGGQKVWGDVGGGMTTHRIWWQGCGSQSAKDATEWVAVSHAPLSPLRAGSEE